jgi:hypothetical protein
MIIKKFNGKTKQIEVFKERIGGKNIYFVSKITKHKIATGEARNKEHAIRWANRIKER